EHRLLDHGPGPEPVVLLQPDPVHHPVDRGRADRAGGADAAAQARRLGPRPPRPDLPAVLQLPRGRPDAQRPARAGGPHPPAAGQVPRVPRDREGVRVRIRAAVEADVPLVLGLIRELAEYERLGDQVTATEDRIRAALAGPRPAIEVAI